jgi:Putative neutral zinc metallopeptidase
MSKPVSIWKSVPWHHKGNSRMNNWLNVGQKNFRFPGAILIIKPDISVMKLEGRRTSGNIEDRRGMNSRKMAVGGGIGTIIIVLVVLLLGGDPSQLLNMQEPGAAESGPVTTTPE